LAVIWKYIYDARTHECQTFDLLWTCLTSHNTKHNSIPATISIMKLPYKVPLY